jgi:HemY protein
MIKLFFIFVQLTILVIIVSLIINYSFPVSVTFDEIILSTSTSFLIFSIILIIFIIILIQRVGFFFKYRVFTFRLNRQKNNYEKGYQAFAQGIIALANKDYKKAIQENKRVTYYIKDKSLNLLLKSETLKIEKKFDELESVYEEMIKNENTKILGLKGLMKQNLYAQDYHHAFIYGEKLFNLNHQIDKIYDTLVKIVSKTNNWHKLIQINEKAFKFKLIDKEIYSVNKSIALYEISIIKKHSALKDSIDLMEQALKLRQYFPPYVCYYIDLLIENNNFSKAKKYLYKSWSHLPHPDYRSIIKLLSKKIKVSYFQLADYITSNTKSLSQSKILMAESLIDKQNWIEAKNQLISLLEHKPSKEVCLLMSIIESGESNDPQRINAWVTRSNFGELNNIWICRISNISQEKWSSVSKSGHFNSLIWKKPASLTELSSSDIESNIIKYIDN